MLIHFLTSYDRGFKVTHGIILQILDSCNLKILRTIGLNVL